MTSTPENQGDDRGPDQGESLAHDAAERQDPTRPIDVDPTDASTAATAAESFAASEPTEVVEVPATPAATQPDEDPLAAFGGEPPSPHTPVAAYEPAQDRWATPERPTGPHLPPILLGVICLAVAGLALWQELADVEVDWGNVGPLGIAAIGALLVVLGLVGLLGSRRREASRSS